MCMHVYACVCVCVCMCVYVCVCVCVKAARKERNKRDILYLHVRENTGQLFCEILLPSGVGLRDVLLVLLTSVC